MSRFAPRPEPPYYAVIFTAQRTAGDDGYPETAERMVELAGQQPGFLGVESTRDASGLGITVSYWRTLDDLTAWRRHVEHAAARRGGRERWYSRYELRIAKVERAYGWDRADGTRPGDGGV
jgi:heme-degrading monooxygenase HmoA